MGKKELRVMRVLVTGGGGFLGFEICKLLVKSNHEVFSFSRNHYEKLDYINVRTIKGSLTTISDIELALRDIDAVIHTAAIAGVWGKKEDFYNTNYLGSKNLVDSCLKLKIKYFVNTSSPSVVFGKDDIINGDESLSYPDKYLTHYAKTKAMAEKYVLDACSNSFFAISLRPHLIFGKDDPHIIPRLVESSKKGRLKIVGSGHNLVDVIHVSNAAKAHVDALNSLMTNESISKSVYFLGQEAPVNLWDFINKILIAKKQSPVVSSISFNKAYYVGFVLEIVYKVLGINRPEPPMTRFIATQLGKNHYFTHNKAVIDFNYEVGISVDEALRELAVED